MDTIELILAAIVTIALVVYLIHFLARRISRELGEKAANQSLGERRRALIRSNFVLALMLILLGWYGFWSLWRTWPPQWLQRHDQRRTVLQRVESSGGWGRLSADTKLLIATNNSGLPVWLGINQTNVVLPESIVQLKPISIEVNPGLIGNTVLFRCFFGGRGRGRSFSPAYSLFVASGISDEAALAAFRMRVSRTDTIRRITNGVFEVY